MLYLNIFNKMGKRGASCVGKILTVFLFFLLINVGFFVYSNGSGFTGMSIKDSVRNTFVSLSFSQKIVFFVQIFIIFVILVFIIAREFGKRSHSKEIFNMGFLAKSKGYETDLDALYAVLKRKKKVHLSSIVKGFRVNRETAMEWCRILESSNLAIIEYPTLGEIYIKIKEERGRVKDDENIEKEDKKVEKIIEEVGEKKIKKVDVQKKSKKVNKKSLIKKNKNKVKKNGKK